MLSRAISCIIAELSQDEGHVKSDSQHKPIGELTPQKTCNHWSEHLSWFVDINIGMVNLFLYVCWTQNYCIEMLDRTCDCLVTVPLLYPIVLRPALIPHECADHICRALPYLAVPSASRQAHCVVWSHCTSSIFISRQGMRRATLSGVESLEKPSSRVINLVIC